MLALLYDVHGNREALDTVLADARERGADAYLVGGDVAGLGPWPAECVARLRELDGATWIRGNWERWTADPGSAPDAEPIQAAIAAAWEALGEPLVRELGELPESAQVAPGTRAWHGSPAGDMRSFYPEPGDDEAELLAGVADTRLIFGHTHLPFLRTAVTGAVASSSRVELVNPGSVGLPLDGDRRAGYALLHPGGEVEHRRVAYDVDRAITRLQERYAGAGWAALQVGRLTHARMDPPPR